MVGDMPAPRLARRREPSHGDPAPEAPPQPPPKPLLGPAPSVASLKSAPKRRSGSLPRGFGRAGPGPDARTAWLAIAAGDDARSLSSSRRSPRPSPRASPRSSSYKSSVRTVDSGLQGLSLEPSARMRKLARESLRCEVGGGASAVPDAASTVAPSLAGGAGGGSVVTTSEAASLAADTLANTVAQKEKAIQLLASALDVGAGNDNGDGGGDGGGSVGSASGEGVRVGSEAPHSTSAKPAETTIHTGVYRYNVDADPRHRFLRSKRNQLALLHLV